MRFSIPGMPMSSGPMSARSNQSRTYAFQGRGGQAFGLIDHQQLDEGGLRTTLGFLGVGDVLLDADVHATGQPPQLFAELAQSPADSRGMEHRAGY